MDRSRSSFFGMTFLGGTGSIEFHDRYGSSMHGFGVLMMAVAGILCLLGAIFSK